MRNRFLYQRRPPWPFRINWDSPQAVGLELLVTFSAYGGVVLSRNNVTAATVNVSADQRYQVDGGLGIDLVAASANYVDFAYPDDPFITDQGLTIVWIGQIDTGIGTFRHFAGKHSGAGGTNNPFDFRTQSAQNAMTLVRAHGTNSRIHVGPNVEPSEYRVYAVRVADNLAQTVPDFFIDGTKTVGTLSSGAGVNGPITGSGANIQIGRRADGVVQMDGYCAEVRFYNRAIPDEIIQSINRPATQYDVYASYDGLPYGLSAAELLWLPNSHSITGKQSIITPSGMTSSRST